MAMEDALQAASRPSSEGALPPAAATEPGILQAEQTLDGRIGHLAELASMFQHSSEAEWQDLCIPYMMNVLRHDLYQIFFLGLDADAALRERYRRARDFC